MPIDPNPPASDYTAYIRERADIVRKGSFDYSSSLFKSAAFASAASRYRPKPIPAVPTYGTAGFYDGITLSSAFTIEWFMMLNDGRYGSVFSVTIPGEDYRYIELIIEDDRLFILGGAYGETYLQVSYNLPTNHAGKWYHYALSGTVHSLKIFMDGVYLDTIDSHIEWTDKYFFIGNSYNGKYPLTGSITNFRVTPSALYADTFSPPTIPLPSGLFLSPSVDLPKKTYAVALDPNFASFSDEQKIQTPISLPSAFTIEWFMRVDYDSGPDEVFAFMIGESWGYRFLTSTSDGSLNISPGNNYPLPLDYIGKWYHYALSGTADSLRVYFNGTLLDTVDTGISFADTLLTIGNSFDGEYPLTGSITNFRVTKSALYTGGTISIPTLPLSGGALLLKMESDTSTNSGTETLDITSTAHLISGSMTFHDSSIKLPISLDDAFTIECFARVDNDSESLDLFMISTDAGYNEDYFELYTYDGVLSVENDNGNVLNYPLPLDYIGKWYHYALSGTADSLRVYFNGTLLDTVDTGISFADTLLTIGNSFDGEYPLTGSITNFRVTKSALYTGGTISIPTLPLSGGALLLKMESDTSTNSGTETLDITSTAFWNADGSASFLNSFLRIGEISDIRASISLPDEFTIECFARVDNDSEYPVLFMISTDAGYNEDYFEFYTYDGVLSVYVDNENVFISDYNLPLDYIGKWYHYALSGTADSLRVYFNGTLLDTVDTGISFADKLLTIGNSFDDQYPLTGSITNFRVTKSALYTGGTISIPTLPLSGGALLLKMESQSTLAKNSGSDVVDVVIDGIPKWSAGPVQDYTGDTFMKFLDYGTPELYIGGPLTIATTSWTFEWFMRVDDPSNTDEFSIYIGGPSDTITFSCSITDVRMINNDDTDIEFGELSQNWTHYAVTFTPVATTFFTNGYLVSSHGPISADLSTIRFVSLYGVHDGTAYYITNLRITNSVLYSDDYTVTFPLERLPDTKLLIDRPPAEELIEYISEVRVLPMPHL